MRQRFGQLLFILCAFAAAASAQTTASRIAIVDSDGFRDEKTGIMKFVTALKAVEASVEPDRKELQTLNDRLKALGNEIQALQAQNAKVPVDPRTYNAKVEQAEQLQRDIKFKTDNANAKLASSRQTILPPVVDAIGKALADFAKQKGYTVIFDVARDQNGLLIALGDEKANVTKEFIAYFNALPANKP
ncbi:MAG TPA: OmpH family outer membrane protein [Pyrinomonadaceae bacterium]|nr:OmpH family outer membrane protein [Pyrinomonadaceae bacterium]